MCALLLWRFSDQAAKVFLDDYYRQIDGMPVMIRIDKKHESINSLAQKKYTKVNPPQPCVDSTH
jgi:hypothetical protein